MNELFRSLEQAGFAVFAKDARGCYLDINDAGARMLGQAPASMRGRDDFAFFEPASARLMIERDRELMRSASGRTFHSLAKANERWTLYLTTKIAALDVSGEPRALIGISGDVSRGRASINHELFLAASESLKTNPLRFLSELRAYS